MDHVIDGDVRTDVGASDEAGPQAAEPGGSEVDTSPVLAAYVVIAVFWAAVGVVVGALVW